MDKVFRRPVVRFGTALILVLIVLIVWGTWTIFITQDRTATIIDVSGTVLYHSAGDSQWVTAIPGTQVHDGDQLFTQAPDGGVTVVSDDGNFGFQLKPDTLVTYTARWNALLETGSGGLYLDHGMLLAETQHDRPQAETHFIIETAAAKATITGSRLVVQALKGMPTTRISALEGEIHVQTASDQADIIRTDLQPIQEHEMVLTAAQTVIVYIEQPDLAPEQFVRNRGRVLDSETQEGVEGVVVQVAGAPELFAVTDEDGYFIIPGDNIYSELVIIGTTEEVRGNLEIVPFLSRITNRVVDASTSQAIEQAVVIPVEYPHLVATTSSDGSFSIEGLPVGLHTLSVDAGGYLSAVVEVTITPDGNPTLEEIRLFTIQAFKGSNFLPVIMKNFPHQYP